MIVRSYAKINLAINIRKKFDNGYHDLDMIMSKVGLYDKLLFSKMKEDKIELTCTNIYIPTDRKNLVYKVIEKFKKQFSIKDGIKVHIIKSIPMQAGLGGGSSNAAETLKALDKMYHTKMTLEQQIDFIKEFGSDIPFFLCDSMCRVEGLGDELTPLENNLSPMYVILIKPQKGVSTKAVYENVDLETAAHPYIDGLVKAIKEDDYDYLIHNIKNTLQDSSIQLRPVIKKFMDESYEHGVDVCMVSGSGSTIFCLTKDIKVVNKIKRAHKNKKNFVYQTTLI